MYCDELRLLPYCNHRRALTFLENLFAKYPTTRDSRFGVRLIAKIRGFLGEEAFARLCDQIGKSDWELGRQAQGELLGISYLADDDFESVDKFVERAIAPKSEIDGQLLTGIAFAAANLWKEGNCRSRATKLFETLAKRGMPADQSCTRRYLPAQQVRSKLALKTHPGENSGASGRDSGCRRIPLCRDARVCSWRLPLTRSWFLPTHCSINWSRDETISIAATSTCRMPH